MTISDPQRAGRYTVLGIPCWAAVSALVGAAATVHLVAASTVVTVVFAALVALGAVVAVAIGVRRHRPAVPAPWYLLGAAVVPFVGGTVIRELTPAAATPLDEICTLTGYVGITLAGLLWLRPRRTRNHPDVLLDSGLIALGALLAAWNFLIAPVLRPGDTAMDTLTAVAFPVFDALMLTLLTHSLATSRRSETALRLVHYGVACTLLTDIGYRMNAVGTVHIDPNLLILPLLAACVLGSAAALHPSMTTLNTPRPVRRHHSRQRASVIAVALVVSSLIPVTQSPLSPADRVILSTVLALLLIGLLIRSERSIRHSTRSERRARYQADHDQLTGLLNRAALLRVLHREHRDRSEDPLCLLFIDLDEFKTINDSYGHAVGDELITEAADRIRTAVRRDDVVARYGGDEFIVLAPLDRDEATKMAERLLGTFMKPFRLSIGEVPLTASIGLACGGPRDIDAGVDGLIRDADAAMYWAKRRGFGYIFHDDMRYTPKELIQHGWRPRETAV